MTTQTNPSAGELVRLGETHEWGELLLHLLELHGWRVTVRHLFEGSGVLVLAERDQVVLFRRGPAIADVACDLFLDATKRRPSVSTPTAPAR